MFAFELWREFKLSIAEIFAVFPSWNIVFCDKKILVLEWISKQEILEKSKNLGWSVKIIELERLENFVNSANKNEAEISIENILSKKIWFDWFKWKFHYAINIFGKSPILHKEILKISKKIIKKRGINARFVNKDFNNVSSTTIIKESLIKKGTDFNLIYMEDKVYFWNTIFVQDIYAYSNRDYGKDRDMNIWMIPPKLAQIMINLSKWKVIYDPFVGLGTILIESIYMWNKKVFGSDFNKRMVDISNSNLERLKKYFEFERYIFLQNARYIDEVKFLDWVDAIVTEWYLWEIMTKNNISLERIQKQKVKLLDLYEWFFSWLRISLFGKCDENFCILRKFMIN